MLKKFLRFKEGKKQFKEQIVADKILEKYNSLVAIHINKKKKRRRKKKHEMKERRIIKRIIKRKRT